MSEQNVVGVARHGSTWQARSGMACLGPSGQGTAVGAWLGLARPGVARHGGAGISWQACLGRVRLGSAGLGSLGVARPGQSGSNMAVPGLAGAA